MERRIDQFSTLKGKITRMEMILDAKFRKTSESETKWRSSTSQESTCTGAAPQIGQTGT